MADQLNNINIVLVGTQHPGNIGAAARAMKNMGVHNLYLVAPKVFPHSDAFSRASGAEEVVEQALLFETIEAAVADCNLIYGTSARTRSLPWPLVDARQAAMNSMQEAKNLKIAILFGPERIGLTNEQLALCHYHVYIPSNPVYSSLNLAAAVQIVCYELWLNSLENNQHFIKKPSKEWASARDLTDFYTKFEEMLKQIKFLDPQNPRKLMLKIRRVFNRAKLDTNELNIFQGIIAEVLKHK